MVRAGFTVLALVLLSGAAFASTAGTADDEFALLQRGIERAQANDCPGAIKAMREAVDAAAFSQLGDRQQYIAQRILAACAYDTEDYPTAMRVSRQVTAMPLAERGDWYMRLLASYSGNDHEDAAATLEKLATTWPDALHDLKLSAIYRLLNDAAGKPEGDARNARILKALFAANWRPTVEAPEEADGFWLRLARYDAEAGDAAASRKALAIITTADTITAVRATKLFDAVVATDPARFDIAKAYAASVGRYKARVAARPDKLEPLIYLAEALYQLDRQDEALALLDDTLAKVKAGTKFADAGDQLNWVYNQRAHVLMALGRADEAVVAMEAGSHIGEDGFNVSQTINLADMFDNLGRPAEAVKVLANFDPKHASPYGVMAAEEARACAYAQLGDTANLDTTLAFARAHADDAPTAAVQMLLCAGHEDEAATVALKYLGDKQKRDSIRDALHITKLAARGAAEPWGTLMRGRWIALGKRPEIVKAVETFGHILTLPIVQ